MDPCPVCDFPASEGLTDLLGRISNPETLTKLAIDFADRVVALTTLDPPYVRSWLNTAREWQFNQTAVEKVAVQAEQELKSLEGIAWVSLAGGAVKEALRAALSESQKERARAASQAAYFAVEALSRADLMSRAQEEATWQMTQTCAWACTCGKVSSGPTGERSRNSLLAS